MSRTIEIDTDVIQLLTANQAWHYRIIPKSTLDESFELFVDKNSWNDDVLTELEVLFGKTIVPEPVETDSIAIALGKYYRKSRQELKSQARQNLLNSLSEDFLVRLIEEASSLNSSDIHLETYADKCRIRIRIDGHLIERYIISRSDYPMLINKIKIRANLDITEKRLPQDGRIIQEGEGGKIDIRVSVLPTLHGEKIVLRLLGSDAGDIRLEELGFNEEELRDFLQGINKAHGMVLISGPTGSGKTTTLYGALKLLNKDDANILTVEDPIEYTLEGINQVQLKENIGLTFSSALRTFLRQDPDIIMLGEIRDPETAQMAVRASMTGHLVLSTIHTNSAIDIVSRLIDMGIPAFLLSTTLNTLIAQRLLRVLCGDCKQIQDTKSSPLPDALSVHNIESYYAPAGCAECHFTGYKGRKAIYEVISIAGELSEVIRNGNWNIKTLSEIRKIRTIADNAIELFKKGKTSLEEIVPYLSANN